MVRVALLVSLLVFPTVASIATAAEPVMVQCGREYQAARTAGTLNGLDWARFRTECAARLKGQPATDASAPAAAAPSVPPVQAPSASPGAGAPALPAAPTPADTAASGGMAAKNARQKQCGSEWRAQKAALVAQTPGLTWPRYWSQCNARLKAAK